MKSKKYEKAILIRVCRSDYDKIKQVADTEDRSVASLFRESVKKYIKRKRGVNNDN